MKTPHVYWHVLHYEYFMEITIGDIDATVLGGTPLTRKYG
jgi:hypothetical protein